MNAMISSAITRNLSTFTVGDTVVRFDAPARGKNLLPKRKDNMSDKMTLYVSQNGNDAWSGRLAESSADVRDGHLATSARAFSTNQEQ